MLLLFVQLRKSPGTLMQKVPEKVKKSPGNYWNLNQFFWWEPCNYPRGKLPPVRLGLGLRAGAIVLEPRDDNTMFSKFFCSDIKDYHQFCAMHGIKQPIKSRPYPCNLNLYHFNSNLSYYSKFPFKSLSERCR